MYIHKTTTFRFRFADCVRTNFLILTVYSTFIWWKSFAHILLKKSLDFLEYHVKQLDGQEARWFKLNLQYSKTASLTYFDNKQYTFKKIVYKYCVPMLQYNTVITQKVIFIFASHTLYSILVSYIWS